MPRFGVWVCYSCLLALPFLCFLVPCCWLEVFFGLVAYLEFRLVLLSCSCPDSALPQVTGFWSFASWFSITSLHPSLLLDVALLAFVSIWISICTPLVCIIVVLLLVLLAVLFQPLSSYSLPRWSTIVLSFLLPPGLLCIFAQAKKRLEADSCQPGTQHHAKLFHIRTYIPFHKTGLL